MSVSAIVVSHGHAAELAQCLPALASEVDELVVVANLPGSAAGVPPGTRVIDNPRPLSLAANVNAGIAATTGELVLVANPDAMRRRRRHRARLVPAGPSSVRDRGAADRLARRDVAALPPAVPDGVGDARPAHTAAQARRPYETQRGHYLLDERPDEPVEADWMLGAFLLQRRAMLEQIGGWDAGYRHYIEDIDLCYRAMRAGWEAMVRAGCCRHSSYAAVIDRGPLPPHIWHARGMARFVRLHPETVIGAIGRARTRS